MKTKPQARSPTPLGINDASVEIRAKERARISHERLGKSSAKNAPLLPHLPQRRRREIFHSSLLFFSSISSWTYYKATRWRID